MTATEIREIIKKHQVIEITNAFVHDSVRPVLLAQEGKHIGKRFSDFLEKSLPDFTTHVSGRAGMYYLEVTVRKTGFMAMFFLSYSDTFTMEIFDRQNTAYTVGAQERQAKRSALLNSDEPEKIAVMLTAYNEARTKVQEWERKQYERSSFPDIYELCIKGTRD